MNVTKKGAQKMTTEKFQRATEFLYQGDQDEAAKLFNEGVAEEVARAAPDTEALVNVGRQKLAAEPAIIEIFDRYPAIKEKRAYSLIADEYASAFMTNGDDVATAIKKAGEAVAEEFGLRRGRELLGGHRRAPCIEARLIAKS
jgi:hypothetical protein